MNETQRSALYAELASGAESGTITVHSVFLILIDPYSQDGIILFDGSNRLLTAPMMALEV